MSHSPFHQLSMRERQIMDALHSLQSGSVADVVRALPDATSYNSIRVTLSILEHKGWVSHRRDGRRYVYSPAEHTASAGSRALRHLVRTFFENSAPSAVSTLLDMSAARMTDRELQELAELIRKARNKRSQG